MASCVRNICTKHYQNLIIVFQVTLKNVGDVFLRHSVCIACEYKLGYCGHFGVLTIKQLHVATLTGTRSSTGRKNT